MSKAIIPTIKTTYYIIIILPEIRAARHTRTGSIKADKQLAKQQGWSKTTQKNYSTYLELCRA